MSRGRHHARVGSRTKQRCPFCGFQMGGVDEYVARFRLSEHVMRAHRRAAV